MSRLHAAIIVALLCTFATVASAGAASPPQTPTNRAAALERILASDRSITGIIGFSFEILRTQPVAYRPEEFVVDAVSANRESGLRALVSLTTSKVLRSKLLAPLDILITQADVTAALALVKNLPSLRTRLGSTLSLYRASDFSDARQQYRVEALPVRSTGRSDPCSVHRCLQLLFHAPKGYVAGLRVLVDLTAGHRIDGPRGEAAPHLPAGPTQTQRAQTSPSALTGLISPECRAIRFFTTTTSWTVCWTYLAGYGLVLGPTSFKRSGAVRVLDVISDARVAQIFVPYATGDPRFYDTSFGFPNAPISPNLCLKGTLLDGGAACLEHRDRDIDWLFPGAAVPSGRRGEEVVLWSVLYAANYLYIEQWGFRDDGVFWGRVGATGQNLPGIETESHTHDYVWRIVPHLGGSGDSVNYVGISEPVTQLTAPDVSLQIVRPTPVIWNPQRFDQLEIFAPGVTNGRGHPTAYRLIPMPVAGLAHHQEPFTQADLWATEGDPLETDASSLPDYAKEKVSLVHTSIALWYRGSFRHQPRDEDGYYDSGGNWIGTTHTFWTGFVFMPRNLFDRSPFF
ncbi:MAG: hypothetical protein M3Z41_03175 [Candidatus Eremiobacteraeota bacterium]|nr:hypothetical protein [Candidatus Eremiobacteraeota bacterium]